MSIAQKQTATQSQKLMIFVLSMSLYGLATLFTELIPKFQVGVVEFSVEYFLFIPLTLAMLFDPLSAALGAATGELVFSEIMLGQFGGLGELEKFLTVTIGVYIAGRLVKNPKNRAMVGVAAITGTAAQLLMGTVVDILKVQLAVEDFEAVAGLPESVFATEGFAFLNDLLFSGILFCLLPTLYLVPKLYGKIEPLLGMAPRTPESAVSGISASSCAAVAMRLRICQRQSFQSSAGTRVQSPCPCAQFSMRSCGNMRRPFFLLFLSIFSAEKFVRGNAQPSPKTLHARRARQARR